MSTRAFLTIVGENDKIIDSAFCPSSAYPSYFGVQVLDALAKNQYAEFLAQIREEYPEEAETLDGIQRSWYVKSEENKENLFYDYAYELDLSKGSFTLYHYGEKALSVPPDKMDLCRKIFELENPLYERLCLDYKTMTQKKDFYKEVRTLIRSGATVEDIENHAKNPASVLFIDYGRMRDVGGRDVDQAFVKNILDTEMSGSLKIIADRHYSKNFTLYVQTPFYRAPITTRPLASAAAVEKELARIVREEPENVRGTWKLFNQIEDYKKAVKAVFENESLPLEDRADKAQAMKMDMLSKVQAPEGKFYILGGNLDSLRKSIAEVVSRGYMEAKKLEDEKANTQPTLAEKIRVAESSRTAAGIQPGENPKEAVEPDR